MTSLAAVSKEISEAASRVGTVDDDCALAAVAAV